MNIISRLHRLAPLLLLVNMVVALPAMADPAWVPIGPEGGDARSFAQDPANPSHIYMGTLSGWMYESQDGGAHWWQLSDIDGRSDLVLDHILVNPLRPRELLVAAWVLGSRDGGLYRSVDSGHTWTDVPAMKGQSIRALSRSVSSPNIIVAGTLLGVFRSLDGGERWGRISPVENAEIHEVESIAIDPKDPDIIYAGTWHLPWKTMDGGANWFNVKDGLIDDSDVFSIILDPRFPSTVYLSACSGIYKSLDAAVQFTKVQGIPSTARRTRVLKQDPVNPDIVYAGTTEGLYKTVDGGTAWARMTSPDLIINDILIDPRNPAHIVLATDRSGILVSENGGAFFADSNRGFMQRQVSALAVDPNNQKKLYVGVLNDKIYGGVFASQDDGRSWAQRSIGLAGRDVYSLAVLPNGDLLAGTNRGLALWAGSGPWGPDGNVIATVAVTTTVKKRNKKTHKLQKETKTSMITEVAPDMTARISSVSVTGRSWFAATNQGLYRSTDNGRTWAGSSVQDQRDLSMVSAQGDRVFVADPKHLFVSADDGVSWDSAALPDGLSQITTLQVTPNGVLWLGGPEGIWMSRDMASTFQKNKDLPINQISSITWDPGLRRVLITSLGSNVVFSSGDDGASWSYWDSGWQLRTALYADGTMFGASLYHGVVMEQQPTEQRIRKVAGN